MHMFFHTTGLEGPRNDPYFYEEYILDDTRAHIGLDLFVTLSTADGPVVFKCAELYELCAIFMACTGYTLTQAQRFMRKRDEARTRAHRGHGGVEWVQGFPGEELLACRCGEIVDSSFNLSAIE